ncbi:serine hydrolase domain-containing protein [Chitinophaga sancti]|uniref:serine hydrolase domain-containing protein n=1 Tax=Chitinophaga sancti TaxID=1004 RepID=UPI002A761415|nr:serine hydrolase domain-containing protein [Chitinophaga sancti]WPQ63570.1 serine hydrolase domain-containing protein [Chitinophaga sancti]
MNTGKRLIAFVLFYIPTLFTQQAVGQQNVKARELDSIIISNMDQAGMVGVGAAVIVNKQVVWMKGYGYADQDKKIPFTPNTIMNIASISKTFTGVCVMKAQEEGKLSLDEDINTYLPFRVINPNFPDEKITLRHLATHTSGITDREPIYSNAYHYGGDSPEHLGDFLKNYFDPKGKYYSSGNFLNQRPGTYWEYSNIATALAGYIVEQVTGEPLNEYSKNHIFKPLGMKNTGWFQTEIDLSKYSKHYDKEGDSLKVIPFYGLPTYPDGGVRTSVSALSKYFIALLNGGVYNGHRMLKQASIEQMQKMQFTAIDKPENINPLTKNEGLFWTTKDGGTKIGYGGTDPGVKTEMLSDLSRDVAVILFTNTSLNRKDLLKYYFKGIFDELFKYGYFVRDNKM